MGILDKLRGLKVAADHADALVKLQAEIDAGEARLEELKNQAVKAPFESTPADAKRIRGEIRETEDNLEILRGVFAETERRRREAEDRELMQEVERRAAKARDDWETLKRLYLDIDNHAAELAQRLDAMKQMEEKLRIDNVFIKENGRPELALKPPLRMLGELLGHVGYPNPHNFQLPGYRPMHPDGRFLARLKDITI